MPDEHEHDDGTDMVSTSELHEIDLDAEFQLDRPALTWPDDWNHVLDTAIRTWGGEWDTKRVQHLYLARYQRGLYRSDARGFLSQLAHRGLMKLHDRQTGRVYTLATRKDVRP